MLHFSKCMSAPGTKWNWVKGHCGQATGVASFVLKCSWFLLHNSMAGAVQVEVHLQKWFSDYLQFWMWNYRQYSPSVAKRLSEYAGGYNWSGITNAIDNNSDNIDDIYDDFVKILKSIIDAIVLSHNINIRSSDPPYISPAIKLLLRQRNSYVELINSRPII